MKKCPKCLKEFNDNAVLCDTCGVELEQTAEENEILGNLQSENASQEHTPFRQPAPNANNNPNKKYIIALIIAVIIIIILAFSKCSSSDTSTQTSSSTVTSVPVTATQKPTAAPTPKPLPTPTPAPVVKEFIKENYGYVDYKELARNPDPYTGKSLSFSGKVIQVIEGDTETQHRIAVNGDYDSVIMFHIQRA